MFQFAGVVRELSIRDWVCCLCNAWQWVKTGMICGLVESWVAFVIFFVRSCGVLVEVETRSTLLRVLEGCGKIMRFMTASMTVEMLIGGECTDWWWPKA